MYVWCDEELSHDLTDSHGPNQRSFGLFHFAGNGGLTGLQCQNTTTTTTTTKTRLGCSLCRQHLMKQPSALKFGHIALFSFKQ